MSFSRRGRSQKKEKSAGEDRMPPNLSSSPEEGEEILGEVGKGFRGPGATGWMHLMGAGSGY